MSRTPPPGSRPCPLCGRPLSPAPYYRCHYCNNPRAIALTPGFEDHEYNSRELDESDKVRLVKPKGSEDIAAAIWRAACLVDDRSALRTYLESRGIMRLPHWLRVHPSLSPPQTYQRTPTMVGKFTMPPEYTHTAIHRTFLSSGRRATLNDIPPKSYIDVSSFKPTVDSLIIGEGIETTLSYYPNIDCHRWATTTASYTEAPDVPDHISAIHILQDNDDAGKAFAERLRQQYREKYVDKAVVVRAPKPQYNDWNDQLQAAS